jgi:2,4-dienoyl-CoA reductase-like NADH-dependent reductase (Old Yellow Enzyme family)
MGDLDLPNRIVMAPLTRMRAGRIDHVPTALQAEYYAQRASSYKRRPGWTAEISSAHAAKPKTNPTNYEN